MKVYELLSDESKWTKEFTARDKNGKITDSTGDDAVCWCLMGAIRKCYSGLLINESIKDKVYEKLGEHIAIGQWNDSHTFEEVRQLAIELDI